MRVTTGRDLLHYLLANQEHLDQPLQIHDHKEGVWFYEIDVEVDHDGVIEIAHSF